MKVGQGARSPIEVEEDKERGRCGVLLVLTSLQSVSQQFLFFCVVVVGVQTQGRRDAMKEGRTHIQDDHDPRLIFLLGCRRMNQLGCMM